MNASLTGPITFPPHRRASRDKALRLGCSALSDVELLGELVGGLGVAERVLEAAGSLARLRRFVDQMS